MTLMHDHRAGARAETDALTPAPTFDGPFSHERKGFFTDTSICIGCKACEVACKEWNRNPQDGDFEILGSSYDNTGALGANTWRHVAFIEQDDERIEQARESGRQLVSLGMPSIRRADATDDSSAVQRTPVGLGMPWVRPPEGPAAAMANAWAASTGADGSVDTTPPDTPEFRWLMSSDVCKHCTYAGCLDVCPTGALYRTEFGTVVVQADVCNGCGTCVAGCPFGVIERRDDGTVQVASERGDHVNEFEQEVPNRGTANKCTLCYDRLTVGEEPACAKACPTESIKFGDHDNLVTSAQERVQQLHAQGMTEARLYGANPNDGVGGTGSVFLLLDEPEVYGLPPDPQVPTKELPQMFKTAAIAAAGMVGAVALAFLGARR